jgi:hypothetical protein
MKKEKETRYGKQKGQILTTVDLAIPSRIQFLLSAHPFWRLLRSDPIPRPFLQSRRPFSMEWKQPWDKQNAD